jgi:hypothetical protein
MGLKFDSVMSREFSGMRPQALIRPGNGKLQVSKTAPRRFEFQERSQFSVRVQNQAMTITTMRISTKRLFARLIQSGNAAPTPTGFAEIVSDYHPGQEWTCSGCRHRRWLVPHQPLITDHEQLITWN